MVKKLVEEFNKLKYDTDRWVWILKNKENIIVMCDNDDTFAKVKDDPDGNILQLGQSIGDSTGIFILLNAIGIKAETV